MASIPATESYPSAAVGILPPEPVIFGRSEAMQAVRQKAQKVAGANVPVLICGESGTGKGLVAKLLHMRSPWEDGPFVKVHCPAILGTLLESELFGYEKGAFTEAYGTKPGQVELAHRGTLFLDEIAELDPMLQAKLSQLLQDGQFSRIGAREDKRVEVRVVCATNRRLEEETKSGSFRSDLFYRINVVNMQLLPLRERSGDIPDLVNYFLQFYREKFNCGVRRPSSRLLKLLRDYEWPGNIRELKNVIKWYVILGSEETAITELPTGEQSHFDPEVPFSRRVSLKQLTRNAVRKMEHRIILKVLQANNWNRKEAARVLRISYRALLYKIKAVALPAGMADKKGDGQAVRLPLGDGPAAA